MKKKEYSDLKTKIYSILYGPYCLLHPFYIINLFSSSVRFFNLTYPAVKRLVIHVHDIFHTIAWIKLNYFNTITWTMLSIACRFVLTAVNSSIIHV